MSLVIDKKNKLRLALQEQTSTSIHQDNSAHKQNATIQASLVVPQHLVTSYLPIRARY
jgi:hypothetical protein